MAVDKILRGRRHAGALPRAALRLHERITHIEMGEVETPVACRSRAPSSCAHIVPTTQQAGWGPACK